MIVKASKTRLVQRVQRANVASYNENPADYSSRSGGKGNGLQYVHIFLGLPLLPRQRVNVRPAHNDAHTR